MNEHLDYEAIRADTVRQVAKLMAAAAITAPKSGGQLFIAGKHNFVETVIVDDATTKHELAEWIRARGKERRVDRTLVRTKAPDAHVAFRVLAEDSRAERCAIARADRDLGSGSQRRIDRDDLRVVHPRVHSAPADGSSRRL